jgi:hypothetical protein
MPLNQHSIPNIKRMNSLLRRSLIPALVACLTLSARLSGADTPAATPAPVASPAANAVPAPGPKIVPFTLPKNLEGVVTLEEYTSYFKFMQSLQQDPEIKALNDQARAKMAEFNELRKQSGAAQQKAINANPEIKAIIDRMRKGKPKPPAAGSTVAPAKAPAAATPPGPTKS